MIGILIAVVVAALVYMICVALGLPAIIGIVAAIPGFFGVPDPLATAPRRDGSQPRLRAGVRTLPRSRTSCRA